MWAQISTHLYVGNAFSLFFLALLELSASLELHMCAYTYTD